MGDRKRRQVYRVTLSGFNDNNLAARLVQIIEQLGGRYLQGEEFHPGTTHVIAKDLRFSEKIFCSIASGVWLLRPEFLEESFDSGRWLPETQFTFSNILPRLENQELSIAKAWQGWRERLDSKSLIGAFSGWGVGLFLRNQQEANSIERLLRAGDGTVLKRIRSVEELLTNHPDPKFKQLLVDESAVDGQEEQVWDLLSNGLPILPKSFIRFYLTESRPVNLLDTAKRYWTRKFKQDREMAMQEQQELEDIHIEQQGYSGEKEEVGNNLVVEMVGEDGSPLEAEEMVIQEEQIIGDEGITLYDTNLDPMMSGPLEEGLEGELIAAAAVEEVDRTRGFPMQSNRAKPIKTRKLPHRFPDEGSSRSLLHGRATTLSMSPSHGLEEKEVVVDGALMGKRRLSPEPTRSTIISRVQKLPRRSMDDTHKCHYCPKKFTSSFELVEHMEECLAQRPYGCEECGKRFKNRAGLDQHVRIHEDYRPHICMFCQQGFVQKCHLDQHLRRHTGEKPYGCDLCGRAFRQLSQKQQHDCNAIQSIS